MPQPLVLVIDEHEDSRIIIQTIAAHAGFATAEARDGRRGIERARALRPAVLVIDLEMQRLSGADTLRAIRADAALSAVPAIAVAGGSLDHEALAAGFQAFVPKPIALATLVADLQRLATPLDAV